jgi:hypothetical protein
MGTLLVRDYLMTHSLDQLEADHGVCSRMNATFDKFSLNYNQLLIKDGDPVAEQCRGLILRPKLNLNENDWNSRIVGEVDVIAWPMNRFYNFGDSKAAEISWNDPELRVYEKLDGTMIVMYWDALHGRWHAGTRAVPEADLQIHKGGMGDPTFSELFWRALDSTLSDDHGMIVGDFLNSLNKELTYVFELTGPLNRVVVKYDRLRATLLAVRHTSSGDEIQIESLELKSFNRPRAWQLHSAEAVNTFVEQADPAQLEGAVVIDSSFKRIKIKNKAWVLSSRAKDLVTVSRRSALLAIIMNKIDDVLPLVDKDVHDELISMRDSLVMYMASIDANFVKFMDSSKGDRKEFALIVNASEDWTPAYFQLFMGRHRTALDWIVSMAEKDKLPSGTLDVILNKIKK